MLQRDLARQRREGEPSGTRRLDKTEVETAWQRAKLEMETDDFLDVLADNPSGKLLLPIDPTGFSSLLLPDINQCPYHLLFIYLYFFFSIIFIFSSAFLKQGKTVFNSVPLDYNLTVLFRLSS